MEEGIPSEPIKVSELGEYVRSLSHQDGFNDQFKNIPSGERYEVTHGKQEYAMEKNRYKHIFPYDHSRVELLKVNNCEESTYINANFMHSQQQYNGQVCIAAQGPMLNTIVDFWRMIWERNCSKIVMLANVIENGKINCEQYWPQTGSETYGEIIVETVEEKNGPHFTTRTFKISMEQESKTVHQFHFTGWVDLKVPSISTGLLEMRRCVHECVANNTGPNVYHCRAGVGRTGTYLAIDYLLRQAHAEGYVDVVKCLHLLRFYRMNMIETLPQYKYVYHTILEALYCKDTVSILCEHFAKKVQNMRKCNTAGVSEIQGQFQVLNIINENSDNTSQVDGHNISSGLSNEANSAGKLFSKIQAYNSSSVCLFVTKTPSEKTSYYFWKFIVENDIQAIVMLGEIHNQDTYWPISANKMTINNKYHLTRQIVTTEQTKVTDILVEEADDKEKCFKVKYYEIPNWISEEKFPKEEQFLELYQCVSEQHNEKILVHCQNGLDRCGLFCALHHVVENIIKEDKVDIFNAVKQIRQCNPHFIADSEQYSYIYSLAETYINCR